MCGNLVKMCSYFKLILILVRMSFSLNNVVGVKEFFSCGYHASTLLYAEKLKLPEMVTQRIPLEMFQRQYQECRQQ